MLELWTFFLPIANIVFAIAFLIVIYSTATGAGLTNYSIKKILPRLIIVAIATNISFYICAALADLSSLMAEGVFNLLGVDANSRNLYASFMNNLPELVGYGVGAILFLLFAGAALLALLVALVVLTARQVLLVMFTVISPLAFVCALLPNTEKYFKLWLDNFVRLLIFYPLFMLAWAGCNWISEAGILTDYTDASGATTVIGFIAAMLLPIIPALLIIPLMKFSGGVMGKMTSAIQGGINKSPVGTAAKGWDKKRRDNTALARGMRIRSQAREDYKTAKYADRLNPEGEAASSKNPLRRARSLSTRIASGGVAGVGRAALGKHAPGSWQQQAAAIDRASQGVLSEAQSKEDKEYMELLNREGLSGDLLLDRIVKDANNGVNVAGGVDLMMAQGGADMFYRKLLQNTSGLAGTQPAAWRSIQRGGARSKIAKTNPMVHAMVSNQQLQNLSYGDIFNGNGRINMQSQTVIDMQAAAAAAPDSALGKQWAALTAATNDPAPQDMAALKPAGFHNGVAVGGIKEGHWRALLGNPDNFAAISPADRWAMNETAVRHGWAGLLPDAQNPNA